MRIISGKFKGRLFTVPKNFAGRPTTDFAREGLFNMLGAAINFTDLATLDLFAGTGAFSLECHSRGASRVQAVELNPLHVKFIQQNFKDFDAPNAKALKADVKSYLNKPATEQYDLIFADPPFDLEWLPTIPDMVLKAGLIAEGGLFILEHPKEHTFEAHPHFEKHRAYGHVHFSFSDLSIMKKIAVFPGSFDPVTRGHQNIVERAAPLFDEVIVALGVNTSKQSMFTLEQRLAWLGQTFAHIPNVRVVSFEGLTVDFCKKNEARYLLRGLRNGGDFEYERTIAHMNKALWNELETILVFTDPEYASVHSTVIRELIKNKGDVSQFVPTSIQLPK